MAQVSIASPILPDLPSFKTPESPMPVDSSFKIEPLTLKDNEALTDLCITAFSNSELQYAFPDTPGMRTWIAKNNMNNLRNKPFQIFVKVVDTTSLDARGRPRLVAYAQWDLCTPEERGTRFLPWHEEMPGGQLRGIFMMLEKNRKRVMGGRKHVFLDTLATHPDYQGRGAGSMLVKWGCDLADASGLSVYVDASKEGAEMYAKFGFVDYGKPGDDVASMARFQEEESI